MMIVHLSTLASVLGVCLLLLMVTTGAQAQPTGYQGLICRGVEESGRLTIGQPGFGPHLISIFVTGPNPLSASQTIAKHVEWVNDPLHSYVSDGSGGLCIWAHPGQKPEELLALPGLAGFELNYAGWGALYDELADAVWRGCVAADRPFLWGYAADDQHARGATSLSWYVARLPEKSERALKQALRSGAFYVSNGPTISDVKVQGGAITLELAEPGDVCWLRAGQFVSAKPSEAFELQVSDQPGKNYCMRIDRGVKTSTITVDKLPVPAGELQFVRAIVGLQGDKMAQTQPMRVTADGKVINTLPATGEWIRGQTHEHSDTPPWATGGLEKFRMGYQEKGLLASFCTDYSYWESPHQWLPEDGTPQVLSVSPSRVLAGKGGVVTIGGLNFTGQPVARIGTREVKVIEHAPDSIKVQLPGDLAAGQYDVVVDNEKFRGTMALGFTVQQPGAKNDGWMHYGPGSGVETARCLSVACPRDEVWIGTMEGLFVLRGDEWEQIGRDKTGAPSVYSIGADADGSAWVATGAGLSHCKVDGTWEAVQVGQTERWHRKTSFERWGRMVLDKDGGLWALNRWGVGVGVHRNGQWQRLLTQDGLPTNSAISITCDKSGSVWLGHGGLHRLVAGKWEPVAIPEAAGGKTVAALAPMADGSVLAAINSEPDKGCLVLFRDGQGEVIPLEKTALPSPRVRDVLVSQQGDVWLATDYGVTRWDGKSKWQHHDVTNSGLGCNIVLGLGEDSQGRIWMATADGASCWKGDGARPEGPA